MMSSLMATLGLDVSGFKRGLLESQADAKVAGGQLKHALGHAVTGLLPFATAAGAVTGLEETIRRSVEWGEKIQNLSNRLGISTDAIQSWDHALRQNGSSIETAATFFEKLATARQKAMQGDDKQIDSFKRLGVALDDLKTKRVEDIAAQIATAFEGGDPQKLIADLRTIGGRGAGEFAAAFRAGLAGMVGEGQSEIHIVDSEDIARLKEAADHMRTIGDNVKSMLTTLTARLLDVKDAGVYQAQMAIAAIGGALARPWDMVNAAKSNMEAVRDAYAVDAIKASEKREKEKGNPLTGGIDDVNQTAKKAESVAKEILRHKEAAAKIDRERELRGMTAAQREVELAKELAFIKRQMDEAAKGAGLKGEEREKAHLMWAKLDEERARVESELERAKESEQKKEMKAERFHTPQVSANQRIGAYVSPEQAAMASLAAKSEGHLKKIEGHMAHLDKISRRTKY